MKSNEINHLANALALRMERDRLEYDKVLRVEQRLRDSIDSIRSDATRQLNSASDEMKSIGVEFLWRKQAFDNIAKLNFRLASVLAEKERRTAALRRSLGRHEVTRQLASHLQAEERRNVERALLTKVLEGGLVERTCAPGGLQTK